MIRVAVTGACGRMGSGIIGRVLEQDDMELVAAIEAPGTPSVEGTWVSSQEGARWGSW